MPLINQVLTKYKQQLTVFMQTLLIQLTNITMNYVNSLPVAISSDILRIGPQQIQNLNLTVVPLNVTDGGAALSSAARSNAAMSRIVPITTATSTNNNVLNFNSNKHAMNGSLSSKPINGDNGGGDGDTGRDSDGMDEMTNISPDTQYVLDIQTMYKAYFAFLLSVVNNDLMDVFLNQSSNDIYKVYCALLQGVQIGTPDISRSCLQVIKKMISFFGEWEKMSQLFKKSLLIIFYSPSSW